MQDSTNLPRTNCPTCGKVVPRRDIRDTKPAYCSQKCGSVSRYATRYSGTKAGPMDRPVDLMSKMKWKPGNTDDIQEPNLR